MKGIKMDSLFRSYTGEEYDEIFKRVRHQASYQRTEAFKAFWAGPWFSASPIERATNRLYQALTRHRQLRAKAEACNAHS
jgi:hypothetical protein